MSYNKNKKLRKNYMKLFVIVRDRYKCFYGGSLTGNMKTYPGVVCKELIPQSLNFDSYRKINKLSDVPNAKSFMTVNEFRKKCNGELPVKFSQVILENLGFDRIWIFDGGGHI